MQIGTQQMIEEIKQQHDLDIPDLTCKYCALPISIGVNFSRERNQHFVLCLVCMGQGIELIKNYNPEKVVKW